LDKDLLDRMLQDPYFDQTPPKSTGLEYFSMSWLENMLKGSSLDEVDIQTSLAELTVQAATQSLAKAGLASRLLVCGGGAHNTFLMSRIAAALPEVVVESTARYGGDPDWVEGLLFAWLARERINGHVQDTPPITGASHPVLLGEVYEP
jgi:anhydro-N-acetylmuramic acid kinase